MRDKGRYVTMIKEVIYQKDITIIDMYKFNKVFKIHEVKIIEPKKERNS